MGGCIYCRSARGCGELRALRAMSGAYPAAACPSGTPALGTKGDASARAPFVDYHEVVSLVLDVRLRRLDPIRPPMECVSPHQVDVGEGPACRGACHHAVSVPMALCAVHARRYYYAPCRHERGRTALQHGRSVSLAAHLEDTRHSMPPQPPRRPPTSGASRRSGSLAAAARKQRPEWWAHFTEPPKSLVRTHSKHGSGRPLRPPSGFESIWPHLADAEVTYFVSEAAYRHA
eukprot:NODE_2525_length_919_cov_286.975694.p1 GENE.NODE_2525_length_919_cov_286.975694~~NODE_2525_length_919_cov_286.975694.p1  ORF type:complete len:232 (-),score=23.57 NODE_2525_length_919_cov_286.975694:206-901(-)